jgi:hypothetical protein
MMMIEHILRNGSKGRRDCVEDHLVTGVVVNDAGPTHGCWQVMR